MQLVTYLMLLIIFVMVVAALWFIAALFASRKRAFDTGIFTMIVGAIGIVVPLCILMGSSSRDITLFVVLSSGAFIFGCGSIAAAIGKKKE